MVAAPPGPIEDLPAGGGGCPRNQCPSEAPVREGTPIGRVQRLERQINTSRTSSCGALGPSSCAAKADPAAAPAPGAGRGLSLESMIYSDAGSMTYPIVDPYGALCEMSVFMAAREGERAPMRDYYEKVKRREEPVRNDTMAWSVFREGKWPFLSNADMNPYTTSPEANAQALPILREFVATIRAGHAAAMPYEPLVFNGHDKYVDPRRFEAEVQVIFREGVVIAGYSMDLGDRPHDYRRFEVAGKSVLLTRDAEGRFRAFENCCRHRGMELVGKENPKGNKQLFVCPYHAGSYGTNGELMNTPFGDEGFAHCEAVHVENRNLIELPAVEKAGILFLIPAPALGADTAQLFAEALPEDLEKELRVFGLGKMYPAAEQTFRLDANWKLMHDTFGEGYHLPQLHKAHADGVLPESMPALGDFTTGGSCGYREWGPRADAILLGRFTTQMMADGAVEEARWAEPSVHHHLTYLLHLAPNTTLFIDEGNHLRVQEWPGSRPGECHVTYSFYTYAAPAPAALKRFKFILDINVTEDMPCVARMQANFESNPHAEVVFGRNEPCLTHEHRWFDEVVKGRY